MGQPDGEHDGHPAAVYTELIGPIKASNPQACLRSPRPAAVIPLAAVGVHKPTQVVAFPAASC